MPCSDSLIARPMLEHRLAEALKAHRMQGKTLLAAVSGGTDSLALVHALCSLRSAFSLRITAAHLNHKLRGDAANADAKFVAAECARLGIECALGEADAAAYRWERRLSPEDAARRVRYAFLADTAALYGANAIVLGHTSDDQAETALMRIIRGSGLAGLRAMRQLSEQRIGQARVTLFRPLLGVSRADTEAYCALHGLQPREDESNLSPHYTRNRIRLELLPLMEQFNPSVRDALVRLSHRADEDDAYIQEQAALAWEHVASVHSDAVTLDIPGVRRCHPAIRSRLLLYAIQAVKGDRQDITQAHLQGMLRLLDGGAGKMLNMPGGVVFSVGYDTAQVRLADAGAAQSPLPALCGKHHIEIPSETRVGVWLVSASIHDAANADTLPAEKAIARGHAAYNAPLAMSEVLDYDSLWNADDTDKALWVRGRLPGDRFQPLGMSRSKKLKAFMSDERIPREWRNGTPLLESGRGIACVAGWRIAHWARITPATKRLLRIRFKRH